MSGGHRNCILRPWANAPHGPPTRARFSDLRSKKLFYALRPAVTLRWMRINAGAPLPPMHFPTAVASAELPPEIADLIADLLARKTDTHEMGSTILPLAVSRFVDGEFEQASRTLGARRMRMTEQAEAEADRLLRRWVLAR